MKAERPADLHLEVREVGFDYARALERRRYWCGGDPIMSHLINALQATFPEGERFFIDAARDGRELLERRGPLPERLRADLEAFYRQEGRHSRQHHRWTEALIGLGYKRMAEFDQQERRVVDWFRDHVSVRWRLSITAACEHYTASLAWFLTEVRPELILEAEPDFAGLLLYHAMEEVEHKSVCFDLFEQLSGSYLVRVTGLALASIDLLYHIGIRRRYLMKQDGRWSRADRREMNARVWGKNGMIRSIWPRVRLYLSPSFHPWQNDERPRLEAVFGSLRAQAGIPAFA